MWFTPRVDLLPFSGHLWPLRREWRRDRKDVSVTLLLGALNFVYVSLALFGLWRLLHVRGIGDSGVLWAALFLVAFALIRTAFLTQMETPEPRYVLECFPAVLALGAMVWLPSKG